MKRTLMTLAILGLSSVSATAQTVVKLGFSGPLTGPYAHIGKEEENSVRLALEDANAAGVTLGGQKIKFELLAEDDLADPKTATTVAQRLVDAGVKGIVGHTTSGASIPASRIYEQAGIPMVTPSTTSPKFTQQGYKVTYRLIANDTQQSVVMAKYTTSKLNAKKIAIIDDRTAYGQGLADAFAESLKSAGGEIVAREYTNDKATDFTSILTKIKGTNPDAVFYGGVDPQSAPLLKQMRQLGMNAKFLGGDGVCSEAMIKVADKAMNDNVYCTLAGLPVEKLPEGLKFRDRYKAKYHAEQQLYGTYSYDAAIALIEAMKLADSFEPAKYLPAMQKVNFKGITGPISFDAKGDVKDAGVTLFQFKDGKWVPQL